MRGCVGWTRWAEKLAALLGEAVKEVEILLIGGAEPLDEFAADRAEDLDGCSGLESGQNADRGARNAEEFAIFQCQDIRRTGAFIHEGNLTEKVAYFKCSKFEFSIGRRGLDDRRAGDQKVKTMPLLAGLDDFIAFLELHNIREAYERGKLIAAEAGKNRKLL